MKADFSNWSHSPDNPVILKKYAETAIIEGLTQGEIPSVVWRDGQFTLTLNPLEGEKVFDMHIVDPRPKKKEDFIFEQILEEETVE
jgi:hypothetical protein